MNTDQFNQFNSQLDEYMAKMQAKDLARMYNSLVERCFHGCVKDFTTLSLTDKEELCLVRCTDKFLKHSAKISRVFAEQGILQQDLPEEK